MAYAAHGDVSEFLVIAAFGATTTPTSTQVTAAIVHADARIDSYIGSASIPAAVLKLASCMIVAEMLERAKKYLIEPEEVADMKADILTPAVQRMLDEAMGASDEIPIVVSSQTGYQTSSNPDDFV